MKTAAKLGVTDKEIDKLCDAVLDALGKEPLDPEAIREAAGKAARNLGEEGKKKGMTTTLPLALGRLQSRGEIRRVPVGGRLDQQRYKYVRWSPESASRKSSLSDADAFVELARHFFRWVGPATMKEFQWFSGLGVKASKDAVGAARSRADRESTAIGCCCRRRGRVSRVHRAARAAVRAREQSRRDLGDTARRRVARRRQGPRDRGDAHVRRAPGQRVVDLAAHAILDRGRLIGYWEYDFDAQRDRRGRRSLEKKDKALASARSRRPRRTCATNSATRARSASTARRVASRRSRR